MASAKRLLSLFLLAIAGNAFAVQADSAREIIRRIVEMRRTPPCTLVQTQVYDMSDGVAQFVVEFDGNGRSRRTAIKPLRIQGTISIDNGKYWATILPDEKRVMLQESAMANRIPANFRMDLIDRNYKLSVSRSKEIAGRKSVTVVALPKFPEMPRREYSLDAETDVVLRVVLFEQGAKERVLLDTIAVRYGSKPPDEFFEIPFSGGYKVDKCPTLRKIQSRSSAGKAVGFAPRTPKSLPFGFAVAEAHLCGEKDAPFIAVRISDGFAQGTVYQWDGKKRAEGFPFTHEFDVQDLAGVRYLIFGELPKDVKAKLIEFFSKFDREP